MSIIAVYGKEGVKSHINLDNVRKIVFESGYIDTKDSNTKFEDFHHIKITYSNGDCEEIDMNEGHYEEMRKHFLILEQQFRAKDGNLT